MNKDKINLLMEKIDKYTENNIIIAFSGGVDSSLILKLACISSASKGTTVYAVTMKSIFNSAEDIEVSKKIAAETGAEHIILYADNFEELGITDNPPDRCYICKKNIFTLLVNKAESLNIKTILDGTNADDMHLYRPGIKALKELGILSPLADSNFTKAEVREFAAYYNISVSKRPSTPCLATRFPYNTHITNIDLEKAEKGENYLKTLGLYNVRLRIHGNIARIETDADAMPLIISLRTQIAEKLKQLGYNYITLDIEGFRSGSMDIDIENFNNS